MMWTHIQMCILQLKSKLFQIPANWWQKSHVNLRRILPLPVVELLWHLLPEYYRFMWMTVTASLMAASELTAAVLVDFTFLIFWLVSAEHRPCLQRWFQDRDHDRHRRVFCGACVAFDGSLVTRKHCTTLKWHLEANSETASHGHSNRSVGCTFCSSQQH